MKYQLRQISHNHVTHNETFFFECSQFPDLTIEIVLPSDNIQALAIKKSYYKDGPYHEFEFTIS